MLLAGHHDLELVGAELVEHQERLVLPRQEHVAEAALGEGGGRAARTGVEHRHVAEQVAEIGLGLGLVAAILVERPAIGGQIVPARPAGGLGIGRDHRHARLGEVAPVLDALRVALADDEHDGRGVGRAAVGQAALPVLGQLVGLLGDGVDVGGKRQRHHVRIEPVDHGAGLLARAAVRLLDGHGLAGLRLPVLGEGLVELLVQLTGRIVGHVQQRRVGGRGRQGPQQRRDGGGGGKGGASVQSGHGCLLSCHRTWLARLI